MSTATVLLYNCASPEWAKLRQIFMVFRVRMVPVEPEQYGFTLDELLSRKAGSAPVEEEFHDPMLVFCGVRPILLDQILSAMGRAGLPRIALKAMLTPTNRSWNSQQLWTELRREHAAVQKQQKNRPD